MSYSEVIRFLKRKSENGFENEPISWIGAEQRFVNALRNSGINNLEEQYIIGTETYTTEYKDLDNNDIIEKCFCILSEGETPEDTNSYYKLVTTKYTNAVVEPQYYVEGNTINMPYKPNDVFINNGVLYCENSDVFSLNQNVLQIFDDVFIEIQKDELFFIQNNGNIIPVITKQTGVKLVDNKKITKETIINHINN